MSRLHAEPELLLDVRPHLLLDVHHGELVGQRRVPALQGEDRAEAGRRLDEL